MDLNNNFNPSQNLTRQSTHLYHEINENDMNNAYSDVINIDRNIEDDGRNMDSPEGQQRIREDGKQTQNVQAPQRGGHQIELSPPGAMGQPENVRPRDTQPQIESSADQGSVQYLQPPELHGTIYSENPELPVADIKTF